MTDIIYAANGMGLGDVWASINYVLNKSIEENKTIKMSTFYIKDGTKKRSYNKKIREIYPLIKSKGTIEIVEEKPTKKLIWKESFVCHYFPSRPRWRKARTNNIVFQFDGKTHKGKNLKDGEEELIIQFIKENGFNPVALGADMTLKEAIEIAAKSVCFVGVDSGFMHVCHSVGIPRFLIRNLRREEEIKEIHWNKKYTLCSDMKDFFEKFNVRYNKKNNRQ